MEDQRRAGGGPFPQVVADPGGNLRLGHGGIGRPGADERHLPAPHAPPGIDRLAGIEGRAHRRDAADARLLHQDAVQFGCRRLHDGGGARGVGRVGDGLARVRTEQGGGHRQPHPGLAAGTRGDLGGVPAGRQRREIDAEGRTGSLPPAPAPGAADGVRRVRGGDFAGRHVHGLFPLQHRPAGVVPHLPGQRHLHRLPAADLAGKLRRLVVVEDVARLHGGHLDLEGRPLQRQREHLHAAGDTVVGIGGVAGVVRGPSRTEQFEIKSRFLAQQRTVVGLEDEVGDGAGMQRQRDQEERRRTRRPVARDPDVADAADPRGQGFAGARQPEGRIHDGIAGDPAAVDIARDAGDRRRRLLRRLVQQAEQVDAGVEVGREREMNALPDAVERRSGQVEVALLGRGRHMPHGAEIRSPRAAHDHRYALDAIRHLRPGPRAHLEGRRAGLAHVERQEPRVVRAGRTEPRLAARAIRPGHDGQADRARAIDASGVPALDPDLEAARIRPQIQAHPMRRGRRQRVPLSDPLELARLAVGLEVGTHVAGARAAGPGPLHQDRLVRQIKGLSVRWRPAVRAQIEGHRGALRVPDKNPRRSIGDRHGQLVAARAAPRQEFDAGDAGADGPFGGRGRRLRQYRKCYQDQAEQAPGEETSRVCRIDVHTHRCLCFLPGQPRTSGLSPDPLPLCLAEVVDK